jgi:hypothetical protein
MCNSLKSQAAFFVVLLKHFQLSWLVISEYAGFGSSVFFAFLISFRR